MQKPLKALWLLAFQPVGRAGLEPATPALKGRHSTAGVNSVVTYKAIKCYKKTVFYSSNLIMTTVSASYKRKKRGKGVIFSTNLHFLW